MIGDDDLAFVEGGEGGAVAESELMKCLDCGQEWHGEHDHFGVVDVAEKFLELEHGGDDKKLLALDNGASFG